MLKAARAAAQQWEKDGDEVERARGAILLGQVYALLGDGKQALMYVREKRRATGARKTAGARAAKVQVAS